MNASTYTIRRATLDDITPLMALWESMKFPADNLARRITEFQVAADPEGKLLGAVGLEIAERHGRVHSEAFFDFSVADHLRPLLWDRLHSVANNHGLLRVWTQEQAPFWSHCGMVKADTEALAKLPAAWRNQNPSWLTLKLREDVDTLILVDKEFALFMEAEKQRTRRAFEHARVLKLLATVVAFGLLALVIVGALYVMRHSPQFMRH